MLISYDKDRWPDRKLFYKWVEAEGFDLPANKLCERLSITGPVLTDYLGKFDYVRRGVLNLKNGIRNSIRIPKKQIAHFRSREIIPYLQNNVTCTRRTRFHVIDEMLDEKARKAWIDTVAEFQKDNMPVNYTIADYQEALVYYRAGYNLRIAWLFTQSGLKRAAKSWYKFNVVECNTPEAWYKNDIIERTDSKNGGNREMSQRSWLARAAIAMTLNSTTSNKQLVLHYIKQDIAKNMRVVPAVYTDEELKSEVLPALKDGFMLHKPDPSDPRESDDEGGEK